jgi:hypothetical protein
LIKKNRFINYLEKNTENTFSAKELELNEYLENIESIKSQDVIASDLNNLKFYSNNNFLISNNYSYKILIATTAFSKKNKKKVFFYKQTENNKRINISKSLKKTMFDLKKNSNFKSNLFNIYLKFVYKQSITL